MKCLAKNECYAAPEWNIRIINHPVSGETGLRTGRTSPS